MRPVESGAALLHWTGSCTKRGRERERVQSSSSNPLMESPEVSFKGDGPALDIKMKRNARTGHSLLPRAKGTMTRVYDDLSPFLSLARACLSHNCSSGGADCLCRRGRGLKSALSSGRLQAIGQRKSSWIVSGGKKCHNIFECLSRRSRIRKG